MLCMPNNECWKMVKFFWKSSVVHKLFVLKDWYILDKNMHLKSDCIFKAVFNLKYSLRNILSIWYGKSVLKSIWKIWIQRFPIFGCLEIIARNNKNMSFGPTLCTNVQWHSLAHEFFFIMWNPSRLSSNLGKKIHVQARAWEVVAISKMICAHFVHYKYLHNGSGIWSVIFISCKLVSF